MEGLITASNILSVALEGYLGACSVVGKPSTIISPPLLNLLSDELLRVPSYVTKLAHAKAALGRWINHAFTTPINSLPDEVLVCIFKLVISTEGCNGKSITKLGNNHYGGNFNCLPKYLDLLSHVCSRWRQIIITSHDLWTHIDLVLHRRSSENLLARAEMRANRAGHLPLDVHVISTTSIMLAGNLQNRTFQYLATIAMRMGSLDLVVQKPLTDLYTLILQTCFSNAVPGTLTKLCLLGGASGDHPHTFLEAAETPKSASNLSLDISQQFLEDLLHPITVLRLYGLYPHWSSRAYHGLVELHLTPRLTPIQMTKSELVGILTSSPELRVLHLIIQITQSPSETAWEAYVCLEQLEVLNIILVPESSLGTLLSFLVPGSKPLQLAIGPPEVASDPSLDIAMKQFFARSNITKLFLSSSEAYLWLAELQVLTRNLQVLAIESIADVEDNPAEPRSRGKLTSSKPLVLHPHSLYITCSRIELSSLRYILELYSTHVLTLWLCIALHGGEVIGEEDLRRDLSQICPVVELLEDEEDPFKDWDLFD